MRKSLEEFNKDLLYAMIKYYPDFVICYRKGLKEGYEMAKGKLPEPIFLALDEAYY